MTTLGCIFLDGSSNVFYIILLLALLAALGFWLVRTRDTTEIASDMTEAANDAFSNARVRALGRSLKAHPIDCIEDSELAIGGLASAFLLLSGHPDAEAKIRLRKSLAGHLCITTVRAEELMILGQWYVTQTESPAAAIPRLGARLRRLSGLSYLSPAICVISDVLWTETGRITAEQHDAVASLKQALRIR